MWCILGFQTTQKEHAVDCLPIHLPGENTPQFHQANEKRSCTSLLDRYFLRSSDLKEVTYEEYYENYVLYCYTNGELLQPHKFVEHPQIGMQFKLHLSHVCQHIIGTQRKKAQQRVHGLKVARISMVAL